MTFKTIDAAKDFEKLRDSDLIVIFSSRSFSELPTPNSNEYHTLTHVDMILRKLVVILMFSHLIACLMNLSNLSRHV